MKCRIPKESPPPPARSSRTVGAIHMSGNLGVTPQDAARMSEHLGRLVVVDDDLDAEGEGE